MDGSTSRPTIPTPEHLTIPSANPSITLSLSIFAPTSPPPFPPPVIILAHGIGTIKEAGLYPFAQRFVSELACAAVLFDYRHWGQSGGVPRQFLSVKRELEDLKTVIAWARTQGERFDRAKVVVWGSSFGGMHTTALLAEEAGSASVVAGIAQCPCVDGFAAGRMVDPKRSARMAVRVLADAVLGVVNKEKTIDLAITGEGGDGSSATTDNNNNNNNNNKKPAEENKSKTSVMKKEMPALLPGKEAVEGWAKIAVLPYGVDVQFPNRIAARSMLSILTSRPAKKAAKIKKPYLVVLTEFDNQAPLQAAEEMVKKAPGAEVLRLKGGHFDVYHGCPSYEENIKGQLKFLRRVLA